MTNTINPHNTVAAVVITFNRLAFLKEIIQALREQTRPLDKIFVIHNSGNDGTAEWLAEQDDLHVITQGNLGSSGGQYTGFKAAYEAGYDWIWTMDDDVVPQPDCLELLLDSDDKQVIRTPLRYQPSGKPFYNDCIAFNLSNPFKGLWKRIIDDEDLKQDKIKADGITFEGPIMHRSIIEKIGYPEKKFFIYGDDTEYFIRAMKAGAEIQVYKNAVLNRKLDYIVAEEKFTWKHQYIIRNVIAIDVLHAKPIVRILRPFAYLLKWLSHCKSFADVTVTIKAFGNGYFYKSENELH